MLADKTKNTRVFIDLMASFTFLPLVTKPTRVTSSTASIIDNIFTNDQAFKHNTTIILTDISDHYPVITNVTISSIAIKKGIKYIRWFTENNTNKFKVLCERENWAQVLTITDVQLEYSTLNNLIEQNFQRSFPIVELKQSYAKRIPWITPELKTEIRYKNLLYRKSIRMPSQINRVKYKETKRILNNKLRRAKRNYYNNKIQSQNKDPNQYWKIIKEIIGHEVPKEYPDYFMSYDEMISEDQLIADRFNEFFVNIGPSLAYNIPTTVLNVHTWTTSVCPILIQYS